jgi:hypothetical protein
MMARPVPATARERNLGRRSHTEGEMINTTAERSRRGKITMPDGDAAEVREEYFLDEPMDVEVEVDDDATDFDRPWRPEEIRVTTSNFSVRNVLDMIDG